MLFYYTPKYTSENKFKYKTWALLREARNQFDFN